MAQHTICVYTTEDSAYFATRIASALGVPDLGRVERKIFPDRERYYRILVDRGTAFMGKTVIMVGSTNTDEALLELYRVGCAIANSGAHRLIFVIPFFGYSTMERAKHTRPIEVVTAKANARMLSGISRGEVDNVFLCMDLHTAGIIHYFRSCMRVECSAFDVLAGEVAKLQLTNLVFATTDVGGAKRIQRWSRHFGGVGIAFANKPERGETPVTDIQIVGDVRGKTVVICDDMTRSGNTLVEAAHAYLDAGATATYAVLSHLALNKEYEAVVEKLEAAPIERVIATNSHPMSQARHVLLSERFTICDVSSVFSETIKEILV